MLLMHAINVSNIPNKFDIQYQSKNYFEIFKTWGKFYEDFSYLNSNTTFSIDNSVKLIPYEDSLASYCDIFVNFETFYFLDIISLVAISFFLFNVIYGRRNINIVFSCTFLYIITGLLFIAFNFELSGFFLIPIYCGAIMISFIFFIFLIEGGDDEEKGWNWKKKMIYIYIVWILVISPFIIFCIQSLITFSIEKQVSFLLEVVITTDYLLASSIVSSIFSEALIIEYGGFPIILSMILLVGIFAGSLLLIYKVENRKFQEINTQLLSNRKLRKF